MTVEVKSYHSKKLDSITFDGLLQEQDPFGEGRGAFDLRSVSLITTAVLVQLAAACYAMACNGIRPVIRVDNESVRSYLVRCGFVHVVDGLAQIEPEIDADSSDLYDFLRGSSPMLIEVTRIETGAALPALLDRIVEVLRNRLKYPEYDAYDVATAVSEICQNTFDHNDGTAGFVALQVYGRSANRFLEIAVSDYGDGLAVTLRRNPKNGRIDCDLEAIRLATKLGSSQHDDPTRGTGLFHLLRITYKHAGSVEIKSGGAKVRYRMDKRRGWAFAVPPIPGAHVSMTLPSKGGVDSG